MSSSENLKKNVSFRLESFSVASKKIKTKQTPKTQERETQKRRKKLRPSFSSSLISHQAEKRDKLAENHLFHFFLYVPLAGGGWWEFIFCLALLKNPVNVCRRLLCNELKRMERAHNAEESREVIRERSKNHPRAFVTFTIL